MNGSRRLSIIEMGTVFGNIVLLAAVALVVVG